MDKRIGAQLYTLRDFCKTADELEKSFAKLVKIGYKTIQISGIGPISAETVKKTADKYNLQIVCTHRSFDEFTNNLDAVIEDHRIMDCRIAGLGSMPHEYMGNIKGFINTIKPIAKKLKTAGLQFAYHNHAFEFMKEGGRFLMDYLIEETDPDELRFIVDVYWLAVAGIEPAEYIRKLGSRAAVIHFKDLAVEDNAPLMTEVMEGNLNWDKIIAACEESGTQYALVEQDICKRDPFESMEISYKNLKTKGFF